MQMENTCIKLRKHTQKRKKYKIEKNRHKMQKTDTKWRTQTQNGENRHKMEININQIYISRLWAISGPNTLIPLEKKV